MPAPRWVAKINTIAVNYRLVAPQIYHDADATDMPRPIRFMLRKVIKAPDFLHLEIAAEMPAGRGNATAPGKPTSR